MVEAGTEMNWQLHKVEEGGGIVYLTMYIEFYVEITQAMDQKGRKEEYREYMLTSRWADIPSMDVMEGDQKEKAKKRLFQEILTQSFLWGAENDTPIQEAIKIFPGANTYHVHIRILCKLVNILNYQN